MRAKNVRSFKFPSAKAKYDAPFILIKLDLLILNMRVDSYGWYTNYKSNKIQKKIILKFLKWRN